MSFSTAQLAAIRARFAHVDTCPYQGKRVFFENAGGALTLNSVVDTTAELAAIADNQGRDNPASRALMTRIEQGRVDAACFLGATGGQIIVGESGTELLFRVIRTLALAVPAGCSVIGSTLEHPATRSAARYWSKFAGLNYIAVPHDNASGSVEASDYARYIKPDTRIATIIHTSPVTGMGTDLPAIAAAVRRRAPECMIVVDGIQHAAHGHIDIATADVDAYVISPYKVFSRHGYGLAWIADRVSTLPHEALLDGPASNYELGTRDTAAYACFSDVVEYFHWLGTQFTDAQDRRRCIEAAGAAIHTHEKQLTDRLLHGTGNYPGFAEMPRVTIIGGAVNPLREALVSFTVEGMPANAVVAGLSARGIRVHERKADHYSANILRPLGLDACVRVSLCHYNSETEVASLLAVMQDILAATP